MTNAANAGWPSAWRVISGCRTWWCLQPIDTNSPADVILVLGDDFAGLIPAAP